MRDFVDGEEEVLVGGSADDVGCEEERPGEEGGVTQGVGAEYLEGDDCEDEREGQRLGAAKLEDLGSLSVTGPMLPRTLGMSDLRVCLYDRLSPRLMRLLRIRPEEAVVIILILCTWSLPFLIAAGHLSLRSKARAIGDGRGSD